jgi:hypothetical protein
VSFKTDLLEIDALTRENAALRRQVAILTAPRPEHPQFIPGDVGSFESQEAAFAFAAEHNLIALVAPAQHGVPDRWTLRRTT